MKAIDLLLVVGAVLIATGGWLVAMPLGLVLAGAGCVAAWFLLGDSTPTVGP